METYSILLSFLVLLIGALYLKKLWLGAAMALVMFATIHLFSNIDFKSFIHPIVNGVIISAELAVLLFGAFLFYKLLQANNHFDKLNKITLSFSSRLSVIIILCYFLGSFMEGVAGFGIPAMLIAPMLFVLGFKPITCIVLPLAANTTAVTFGALGTPLKLGLEIFEPDAIVEYTLLINFIPAVILPILLAFLFEKTENSKVIWRENWKMLIGAGLIYATIYAITGLFTIEYTSVISGIAGLLIFVFFFVPKKENPPFTSWLITFYPYIFFILFLLIAKYFFSDSNWSISDHVKPISFYQPGVIFIFTGLLYYLIVAKKSQPSLSFIIQCKSTFQIIAKPVFTIFLIVCYAQIIRSDLATLAQIHLKFTNDYAYVIINPLLGIFGSFISGSATMSNIIFGNIVQTKIIIKENLPLLIALLHTGSAIGNSISLQNILMVKSVVNAPQINYSKILKLNLIIVAIYFLLVISLSFILLS